jgi:hypothetical protein
MYASRSGGSIQDKTQSSEISGSQGGENEV